MIEPHQIGIVYNGRSPKARELASAIRQSVGMGDSGYVLSTQEAERLQGRLDGVDLIITVGGDGTILRAVRLAAPLGAAILGVNLGRLGFMTEMGAANALEHIPWYLAGNAWVDERAMLDVKLIASSPLEVEEDSFLALNEVVVGRGAVSRLVQLKACVDGVELTTYRADAVIVATGTGSTGYALSAGGPVMHPRSKDILLKAVAPQISLPATVVLWPEALVELTNLMDRDATLSVDGYADRAVKAGKVVRVTLSQLKARFLRAKPEASFFETLTQRLGVPQTTGS